MSRFYDPTGPATGFGRVLRGGSWGDLNGYGRGACRDGYGPVIFYDVIGFRCCSVSPGP